MLSGYCQHFAMWGKAIVKQHTVTDYEGHTNTEQENEQEQTEVVYTSESDQNETHNEDFENIFRTPEDDFGAIGLSDSEQTDLPFLPVAALTGTNSSKSRTSGMCCTCLNATAEYIFIPCGHLCICDDCQKQLEDEKCPLCRETYTNCIRAITT
ncbi:cell growth regulator with RING finger domain protein 1-like [Temnothorax curvispinosus]|uniref:Cell growth regulator with RING finger domain protein 1-like n=1 Tax=Temnothorax curvispinosus TaxID=300111 RepID=A0A6J1PBW8_9HYME|nr:cell growth regulator with RING finger domain protein 1-like [Temnothorax curvispinosus]